MFKSIVPALVIASALAVPALAQAQQNGPVTRAEVKAELAQLERAGYNPASDQTTYPAQIQAAEARVSAQQGAAATSYGGVSEGASASGSAHHSGFLSRFVRPQADADVVGFKRP
jgi:hypothetical protein